MHLQKAAGFSGSHFHHFHHQHHHPQPQPPPYPSSHVIVHQPPPPPPPPQRGRRQHHHHHHHKSSVSHSSDSSSAYSGSDTMQSSPSSASAVAVSSLPPILGGPEQRGHHDHHQAEVDLSGLMESVVDSDEEEEEDMSEAGLSVRDAVRECLEKDPTDRTSEDVDVLLEFTQHLKAFTNMTLSVRRALVATMVFAVVEKAGTVVMTQGEELDSWSVIINGHVEVSMSQVGGKTCERSTRFVNCSNLSRPSSLPPPQKK